VDQGGQGKEYGGDHLYHNEGKGDWKKLAEKLRAPGEHDRQKTENFG